MNDNIILIGMAGCGKSTVGVLLAKTLGREFLDTDLIIQRREGMLLQEIINRRGLDAFRAAEEAALLSVDASRTVIATGGSAIYSKKAMEHMAELGKVVYLAIPLDTLKRRIGDPVARGVAMEPGMTLEDLYDERVPLCKTYASMIMEEAEDDTVDTVAQALSNLLSE